MIALLYLFLFLGMVLILLNFKKVFNQAELTEQIKEDKLSATKKESNDNFEDLIQEIKPIDDEMREKIKFLVKETEATLEETKKQQHANAITSKTHEDVGKIIEQSEKKSAKELFEKIYKLKEKGKSNKEIAQEFNMGEGEVEFILGLRR